MTQDATTYYVWIGGSSLIVYFIGAQASKLGTCDYGHKERAGGAAIVIEHGGSIISRDVISDLNTTEFRMMLSLMVKVMNELPEGSSAKASGASGADIIFLTNAAYIQTCVA